MIQKKKKRGSCRAGFLPFRESVNKQGQKVGGNVNIKGHLMSSRWKYAMSLESGGKALSATKWQRTWLSCVPGFLEDTTVSADVEISFFFFF